MSDGDSSSDDCDDQSLDNLSITTDEVDLSQPLDKNLSDVEICKRIIEVGNQPIFEDITPMVNSTVPFLIDCDMLMLSAVQQSSHDSRFGNQTLHVVYTCERILDVLLQKGATFVLIFVDAWELAWDKNTSLLALRKIIHQHFTYNTTFHIRSFPSYFSREFRLFLREKKPRCILTDLNIDINALELQDNVSIGDTVALFAGQLVICLFYNLPMIDVRSLTPKVSLIKTFHLKTCPLHADYMERLSKITLSILPSARKPHDDSVDFLSGDAMRSIILKSCRLFLSRKGEKRALRLILLTYAAKCVPIGDRATPKLRFSPEILNTLQYVIFFWHNCLNDVLSVLYYNKERVNGVNFDCVSDIWQGTLFATILYHVLEIIENGAGLGTLQNAYESYVNDLNKTLGDNEVFEAYPVYPLIENVEECVEVENVTQGRQELVPLQKINNPLIEAFCGDVFDQVLWHDPKKYTKKKKFLEERHWHNRKPLTEEYEQVKDSGRKILATRKDHRDHMRSAKYLNFYGENLEGRQSCYDPIVYQDPNKRNTGTKKKQTNKSKELQRSIIKEKARETLAKETKELEDLKKTIKGAKFGEDPKAILRVVDTFLSKITQPESKLKTTILKLKILAKAAKFDDQLYMAKEMFLAIRDILLGDTTEGLSEKDKSLLSKLLRQFGFREIADKNGLPRNVTYEEVTAFNWIRFQLEHVSCDLLRKTGTTFDPDVNFTPDEWQEEFIDAIRKNESALVVAPTSSGKTFACYYCMKRVLQQSEDGVVVYVSPTKALVNQVAATVTNRFKKTTLPDGVALVGVFTRDWSVNCLNSRILITVPQCLDILLLSSKQYKWSARIRYVIFDEVHKLSGDEEGLVWERLLLMINCPFLALSATISEPQYFHEWLQSLENAKREMDLKNKCARESYNVRFVIHSERHSDLTKYVFLSNKLHHYHPYAALHGVVLRDNDGIPESISLSPRETLQLYDVLCSYEQSKRLIDPETHLEEYFASRTETGFVTRSSVAEYAKVLGRVFYRVFLEHEDVYEEILAGFNPPSDNDRFGTRDQNLRSAHTLLNRLADDNMLPVIVFSYNRKLVEALHLHMVKETMKEITRKPISASQKRQTVNAVLQEEKSETRKAKENTSRVLQRATNYFNENKGGLEGYVMYIQNKFSPRVSLQNASLNPLNILKDLKSKFKGIGIADSTDMQFLEGRIHGKLSRNESSKPDNYSAIVKGYQLGIAYHHAGVTKCLRDTTEMLFRMGILKVVIATGTLALGIHMPCKSVVVFGDSPFLNSLEYHQMSGRAGRRGFDNEGNVIFTKLTKERRDMLMTDKLPKMLGNYPMSVTVVARLLLLITKVEDGGQKTKESRDRVLSRALILLENSLVFKLKPQLKLQIKQFVGFAVQLLLMQSIIDQTGAPLALTVFVHHLHYHEPANLIFSYLIKHGVIRKMLNDIDDDVLAQYALMVVLTHLFSNMPLSRRLFEKKFDNSVVVLEPLPDIIVDAVKAYNEEVNFVFNEYFISVARLLLKDRGNVPEKLPLSNVEFATGGGEEISPIPDSLSEKLRTTCVPRLVTSPFVALSSNDDTELKLEELISNIRHEMSSEVKIVPTFDFDRQLNAYPLDFYRHGIKKAISEDNGLRAGEDFTLIKDFYLILKVLVLGLEDLEAKNENDILLKHMKAIHDQYSHSFRSAYCL